MLMLGKCSYNQEHLKVINYKIYSLLRSYAECVFVTSISCIKIDIKIKCF